MTVHETETRASVPLADDQVALLRSLLLCQVAEHADQVAEQRATADALTGQTDTDSVLEREIAEATAAKHETALADARDALRRLDEGTYGVCETCARPVPFERLEAVPHTRRCVGCLAAPARLLG